MKQIMIMLIMIILLAGCAAPTPIVLVVTATPEPMTDTPVPTMTATATNTVLPSETPTRAPTKTPKPTLTKAVLFTLRPTQTPTSIPSIVLTGTGDSVVDFTKDYGPAIVKIKYTGSSNFIVTSYTADNERVDTVVNTIGNYAGTQLMDIHDYDQSARFQIKASGPWEIQVLPLDPKNTSIMLAPGSFSGVGDDVLIVASEKTVDQLKIDASGAQRNFIVYSWTSSKRDLLVNDIAPYTGIVLLPKGTFLLEVKATGPWKVEVTTK